MKKAKKDRKLMSPTTRKEKSKKRLLLCSESQVQRESAESDRDLAGIFLRR